MTYTHRRFERLFYLLISAIVLVVLPAHAAEPNKTVIADTIYRADGTPARGTVLISWPAFSSADGKPVAAGTLSFKIAPNGSVNIPLLPTQGATPSGTAYKVVLSLDDGSTSTEYWAVPTLSPTTIAAIRSAQMPATVAMQVVSREYVDGQLATAVRRHGDEAIDGVKDFAKSPLVPPPGTDAAAANKGYVDVAIAAAAPSPSNVLNINKGGTGTGSFTPARCVRVADTGDSLEAASTDCGGANADTVDGQHADQIVSFGRTADAFPGATAADRIRAACSSYGTSPGTVFVPGSMSLGNPSAIPDHCGILDLRHLTGPDHGGNEGSAFSSAFLFRTRFTAERNYTNANVHMHFEPFSGGSNCLGDGCTRNKTNYSNLQLTTVGRTPGQLTGVNVNHNHYANGDTFGVGAVVQSWGGINAPGDEGTVGVSAVVYQGDTEFSGTVAAVNGTTLSFTNGLNGYSRGEGRPLIITTPGKTYTAGTVVAISGANPSLVTGSGSQWSTLGTGAHTNLFFCLDSEVRSEMRYCLPVKSIDSDTQLTLGGQFSGMTSTGTYKIYRGGMVQALNDAGGNLSAGSLVVSPATDFAPNDTFSEVLDWRFYSAGLKSVTWQRVGGPQAVGSQVLNIGTIPGSMGYQLSGPWVTGFHIPNEAVINQAVVSSSPAGNPAQWYVSDLHDNENKILFQVNRNTGKGVATFTYDRATDRWTFGRYAQVDTLNGGASFGFVFQPGYALTASAYPNYQHAMTMVQSCTTSACRVWDSQYGGVMYYAFNPQYAMFGNGIKLQGKTGTISPTAENLSAPSWQIDSATGDATVRSVTLSGAAQPACTATNRGQFWYAPGAAGVKDTVAICAKDASDAYAWRSLY